MSTASKIALASTAGVLVAGAAGLAATRKGRKFSRKMSRKITPVVKQQWHTIVNSVEAALIEAGLLAAIPAQVRMKIMQRLDNGHTHAMNTHAPSSNGQRRRRSRKTRTSSRTAPAASRR